MQSRFVGRAALRAVLATGVGSVAALPLRRRPGLHRAIAAGAIALGAGLEVPAVGVASLGAGLALLRKRPRPSPAVGTAGIILGGLGAAATTRWWPVAPRTPAQAPHTPTPVEVDVVAGGSGVVVVVNPSSGPAYRTNPADELREKLPDATVLELGDGLDLDDALARARDEARVIGVAGGDGTVNAAAGAALEAGLPLLVIPGGTLNHFARDLGVTGVDDGVEALSHGARRRCRPRADRRPALPQHRQLRWLQRAGRRPGAAGDLDRQVAGAGGGPDHRPAPVGAVRRRARRQAASGVASLRRQLRLPAQRLRSGLAGASR